VTGGDDLMRRLNQLPAAVSRKVQIDALKAGAAPIRSAAEALAPRGDIAPHIADNIIVSVASTASADARGSFDTPVVDVGPRKSFFYGYMQEVGTAFHPAQPFMRPAFDSSIGRSLNIIRADLWASIRKRLNLGGSQSTTSGTL
jgi:HK97 gp10 family phage protein